MSKKFLAFLAGVIFVFGVSTFAFAQESTTTISPTLKPGQRPPFTRQEQENIKQRIESAREKNMEIRETMKKRASEAAVKRQQKLSEARLKLCENRSKTIKNRIKAVLTSGALKHRRHEQIYKGVDNFYNTKLVTQGHTLANYTDLKAEVEANKLNVQTLLGSLKTSGEEFDCSLEDPKGNIDAFNQDLKELIAAEQEYRKSIHNFVKAVIDLAKSVRPSGSPTPTEELE